MATMEANGLLTVKDSAGNLYIIYPITKLENIDGLEVATATSAGLISAEDKAKLDKIAYTLGIDNTGVYVEEIEEG